MISEHILTRLLNLLDHSLLEGNIGDLTSTRDKDLSIIYKWM